MATKQGLNFGTDIVFTYGPLGFLRVLYVADPIYAVLAWSYQGIIFVMTCVVVIEVLRRAVGPWVAVVLTVLAFSLVYLPLAEKVFVLAIGLVMLNLREGSGEKSQLVLAVGGGILAGVEMLTKFSAGPVVFIVVLIGVVAGRGGWRMVVLFLGTFGFVLSSLWFATGQGVANIGPYLQGSIEISSGYREAMTVQPADEPAPVYWVATLVLALAVVCLTAIGGFASRRERIAAVVVVAITSLVLIKQGTWRYGIGQIQVAVSTLLMLWLVVPQRKGTKTLSLVSFLGACFGMVYLLNPGGHEERVNLLGNARTFVSGLRTASSPERLRNLIQTGRHSLQALYQLSPAVLEDLRGERVAIQPWEINIAWAYELAWDPLPVFQDYAAYTEYLDEINAQRVREEVGPSRILRPVPTSLKSEESQPWGPSFFGRVPAWDPPAQQRAIYCNFTTQVRDERWEVLKRGENRCLPLERVRVIHSSFGHTVRIPAPGRNAVTVLRLYGAEVAGQERLWSLIVHADQRYAVIDGATTEPRVVVPGTTPDGLMVRGGVPDRDGNLSPDVPQVRTLQIKGRDGRLRFEFFRMPIRVADEASGQLRAESPQPRRVPSVAVLSDQEGTEER